MWHPVTLLILWCGFAALLQCLNLSEIVLAALACTTLAIWQAPQRCRRLLWKSRWLLLSLLILFVFFTPGEYLPGYPGMLGVTYDGLQRAGEHIGLIVAMLTSLALLHERVGTPGLLAGLYALLAFLKAEWRDKTIVRLMLVLEFVENRREIPWRAWLTSVSDHEGNAGTPDSGCLEFRMPAIKRRDKWAMTLILLCAIAAIVAQ